MAEESIGSLYPTKIPGYADAADIQEALRLYHYGSKTYDPLNTTPSQIPDESIAGNLRDINAELTVVNNRMYGSTYSTTEPDPAVFGTIASGFIWVDSDDTFANNVKYSAAQLTNSEPENPVDGMIWVDKDSSPRRAYVYDAALTDWIPISELQNVVAAKGDLIYGTADNEITNLTLGSEDQLLSVASSGIPEWKTVNLGSETEIASGTISSSGSTLSGIPGTYRSLKLVLENVQPSVAAEVRINLNSTTGLSASSSVFNQSLALSSVTNNNIDVTPTIEPAVFKSLVVIDIPEYASSTYKFTKSSYVVKSSNSTDIVLGSHDGVCLTQLPVSSIFIALSAGTFAAGTYRLYGVK